VVDVGVVEVKVLLVVLEVVAEVEVLLVISEVVKEGIVEIVLIRITVSVYAEELKASFFFINAFKKICTVDELVIVGDTVKLVGTVAKTK
jgi:hypothetical protein